MVFMILQHGENLIKLFFDNKIKSINIYIVRYYKKYVIKSSGKEKPELLYMRSIWSKLQI